MDQQRIFLKDNNTDLQSAFLVLLKRAGLPHPSALPSFDAVNRIAIEHLKSEITEFASQYDLSTEESDLLNLWAKRYLDLYQQMSV